MGMTSVRMPDELLERLEATAEKLREADSRDDPTTSPAATAYHLLGLIRMLSISQVYILVIVQYK